MSRSEPTVRVAPIAELHAAAYNPRKISDEALAGLKASIARFGLVQPIVVNRKTNTVVGGHQRLRALREAGETTALVLEVDLPATEEKALNLALNSSHLAGEWTDGLDVLLTEMKAELGAGFGDLRFDALQDDVPKGETDIVEDEVPEPPKVAVTRPGDLWTLGAHRVLCADARDAEAVKAVCQASVALAVTDPPYCSGGFQEAGRAAGTWGEIAADNLSTRGFIALLTKSIEAARPQTTYLFTDWRMWIPLYDLVESSGLAVRSMIVWDKGTPGLGALWRTQHELVMFASREKNARIKGKPAIGNVIQAQRTGNQNHYTEKPVSLLAAILNNDASSERGECLVFDPFAGSGSTLIAAEQIGRPSAMLDVEPRWIDVIVERWQNLTGQKATRQGAAA